MKLYQNKAASHISKSTTAFLRKIKINTSIECMPFQHTSAKFPNGSSTDCCVSGPTGKKRALSKSKAITTDELWKAMEEK